MFWNNGGTFVFDSICNPVIWPILDYNYLCRYILWMKHIANYFSSLAPFEKNCFLFTTQEVGCVVVNLIAETLSARPQTEKVKTAVTSFSAMTVLTLRNGSRTLKDTIQRTSLLHRTSKCSNSKQRNYLEENLDCPHLQSTSTQSSNHDSPKYHTPHYGSNRGHKKHHLQENEGIGKKTFPEHRSHACHTCWRGKSVLSDGAHKHAYAMGSFPLENIWIPCVY